MYNRRRTWHRSSLQALVSIQVKRQHVNTDGHKDIPLLLLRQTQRSDFNKALLSFAMDPASRISSLIAQVTLLPLWLHAVQGALRVKAKTISDAVLHGLTAHPSGYVRIHPGRCTSMATTSAAQTA